MVAITPENVSVPPIDDGIANEQGTLAKLSGKVTIYPLSRSVAPVPHCPLFPYGNPISILGSTATNIG